MSRKSKIAEKFPRKENTRVSWKINGGSIVNGMP